MKNYLQKLFHLLLICGYSIGVNAQTTNFPFTPNGEVFTQEIIGNNIYLGGSFSGLSAKTGPLVGLNSLTGSPVLGLPTVSGGLATINSIAVDPASGTYFIAGNFTTVIVNGFPSARNNIAQFSITNHAIQPFNPYISGTINKILVQNGVLYVAGGFTASGLPGPASTRRCLLAYSLALTTGVPSATSFYQDFPIGNIYDLAIANGKLYAGGNFRINTTLSSFPTGVTSTTNYFKLASFSISGVRAATVLTLDNWYPDIKKAGVPSTAVINCLYYRYLTASSGTLYFGGDFTQYGTTAKANLAGIPTNNPASLDAINIATAGGVVKSITGDASGNILFVGGTFTSAGGNALYKYLFAANLVANGGPALYSTFQNTANNSVTKIGVIQGQLFVSGNFTILKNMPIQRFGLFTLSVTGTAPSINLVCVIQPAVNPGPNAAANDIMPISASVILAGGSFTSITPYSRMNIAAIDLTTGLPTTFAPPVAGNAVYAISSFGTGVSTKILIGGDFTLLNGISNVNFGVVNVDGSAVSPQIKISFTGGIVRVMKTDGTANGSHLYVGGDFNTVSTINDAAIPVAATNTRLGLAVFDNFTAAIILTPGFTNPTFSANNGVISIKDLDLGSGKLFAVGQFNSNYSPNLLILNSLTGANLNTFGFGTSTLPFHRIKLINSNEFIHTYFSNAYYYISIYNFSTGSIRNILSTGCLNVPSFAAGPGFYFYITFNANSEYCFRINTTQYNPTMVPVSTGLSSGYFNSIKTLGNYVFLGGSFSTAVTANLMALNLTVPLPPAGATNLVVNNPTLNTFDISWSHGSAGARSLVLVKENVTSISPLPTIIDGQTYTGDANFPTATVVGSGAKAVYDGTGTNITVSGLLLNTNYAVSVFEYNGTGTTSAYNTTNVASGTTRTLDFLAPTVSAAGLGFFSVGLNSMIVSWTKGNGTKRIVVACDGTAPNTNPVNDFNYTGANSDYNAAQALGNGKIVYNGNGASTTVVGLISAHTYYFKVFEYNASGSLVRYKTTTPASGSQATLTYAAEPTTSAANLLATNLTTTSTRLSFTKGNGASRLVILYENFNGGQIDPTSVGVTDGIGYSSNSVMNGFPSNSINLIQSPNPSPYTAQVVYNGTGQTVDITGLSPNTAYLYAVIEYNSAGAGTENYLSTPVTYLNFQSMEPLYPPDYSGTNITGISSKTGIKISWDNGNGNARIVIARQGLPVTFVPVTDVNYVANANFGSGLNLGNGNYVVYNGNGSTCTISNLMQNTTYFFSIYDYNTNTLSEYKYALSPGTGNMDTETPSWPKRAGGTGTDAGGGVVSDASGNVYVAGTFSGSANWGLTELNGQGNDIFLAKYNSTGTVLWVVKAGGTDDDAASSLAIAPDGYLYITGSFRGTASFGLSPNQVTLTSAGIDDAFIAKYDASGNFIWVRQAGGIDQDVPFAIAVDALNNPVITGYFSRTLNFINAVPATSVTANNSTQTPAVSDIFVAKYDPSGAVLWARKGGSSTHDYAYGVSIGASNSVIVSGEIRGNATFGTQSISYTANSDANTGDIALIKYSSTGSEIWAYGFGGIKADVAFGVVANQTTDDIFVTGGFFNTIFSGANAITSVGGADAFVAKFNGSGTLQWAKRGGGPGEDVTLGISQLANGNVVAAGNFSGVSTFDGAPSSLTANSSATSSVDIFTLAYSTTGGFIDLKRISGDRDEQARGVYSRGTTTYITGYYAGLCSFGGYDLESRNRVEWDIFVHNVDVANPTNPISDLVTHFKFNGNASDAANGYNGTIFPVSPGNVTPTADRNLTANSAYDFSGNSYVQSGTVTNNAAYNNVNEVTVSAWIKPNANFNQFRMITYTNLTGANLYNDLSIGLYLVNGNDIFGSVSNNGSTLGSIQTPPTFTLSTSAWTHVAMTYKGGVFTRLYVNGSIIATSTTNFSSLVNLAGRSYTIGAYKGPVGVDYGFYGKIDDVRLYRKALSSTEISDITLATSSNSFRGDESAKSLKLNPGEIQQPIWPNPSNGLVNIPIQGVEGNQVEISMYDLSGKLILVSHEITSQTGLSGKQLNLEGINNGYYLVQVRNGDLMNQYKLVIAK